MAGILYHISPYIHTYANRDLVGGGSGMEICTNYSRATKGQTMLTPKADQSQPKPSDCISRHNKNNGAAQVAQTYNTTLTNTYASSKCQVVVVVVAAANYLVALLLLLALLCATAVYVVVVALFVIVVVVFCFQHLHLLLVRCQKAKSTVDRQHRSVILAVVIIIVVVLVFSGCTFHSTEVHSGATKFNRKN